MKIHSLKWLPVPRVWVNEGGLEYVEDYLDFVEGVSKLTKVPFSFQRLRFSAFRLQVRGMSKDFFIIRGPGEVDLISDILAMFEGLKGQRRFYWKGDGKPGWLFYLTPGIAKIHMHREQCQLISAVYWWHW